MRTKTILLLIIVSMSCANIFGQNTNLFSYSNSVDYANYLYHNGEYKLASSEFKRILFMAPRDTDAAIKIHDCYIRSGDFKSGLQYSLTLSDTLTFNDTLHMLQGKLLLLNEDFPAFNLWLGSKKLDRDIELFLTLSGAMFQNNWQLANEYVANIASASELNSLIPIVKNTALVHYKKPALSALISAVIPGSGKVYSGYWKDGIFSLLFVGVSTWQAYNGFHRDGVKSKYGWIMAGIGFSFYTGNIYGGAKAANKRNFETNHRINHEYKKAFINTYSRF